ncbi:exodeoxyribonuclease III [Planococcus lenghuensis]|uniref:exodeoxyribonuclease III n=1 Tax=Planococcus lenghuensis TaxID=2213202 RepID=UPI0012EC6E8A|nr:exodeoxyribonuclease III [Planococcus lenghuensis]
MKLISWNVNGLRAVMKKGFIDFFEQSDADVVCLQEIKLQEGQIDFSPPGYFSYWHYAERKGYSGTAIFTKQRPLSVRHGLGIPEFDTEGRIITLEMEECYVVTAYVPNSQHGLLRLDFRLRWEEALANHLQKLDNHKPVIFCGDLNVAHEEIDLRNPKANLKNSGFTPEERGKFADLLAGGLIDTYRYIYPEQEGSYTWWSYRTNCRERNIGWRIDYFLASERLADRLIDAVIHRYVMGSDHCPIELQIRL